MPASRVKREQKLGSFLERGGKKHKKYRQIPECIICQKAECIIFQKLKTTGPVQRERPSFLLVEEHSENPALFLNSPHPHWPGPEWGSPLPSTLGKRQVMRLWAAAWLSHLFLIIGHHFQEQVGPAAVICRGQGQSPREWKGVNCSSPPRGGSLLGREL